MLRRLVLSPHADCRLECARAWLAERSPAQEVLVVGAQAAAAAELVRSVAAERGAAFGWHRTTPTRLAGSLAAARLVARGAVPVAALAAEAVATRVLHGLAERDALGRFRSAGRGPGLARALAAVLGELRAARIAVAELAAEAPDLAVLSQAYTEALAAAGLADRAIVIELAADGAREGDSHPWLGLPLLLLDVPVETAAEQALLAAVASRSPGVLATVPAGDEVARRRLEAALGVEAECLPAAAEDSTLRSLQRHLFEESTPSRRDPQDAVQVLSAPGEGRECVEIARRIQRFAREGMAFDRMAVLLRSPDVYGPHLVEALRRAAVPAYFARGTRLPDPSGRALLALLACAAEGLSARRFSEYLSLGEVPRRAPDGAPPPALPATDRWVPPDDEALPERLAAQGGVAAPPFPEGAGSLPAPRRWEQLLVDAAVIGGRARWERRLAGLARELELEAAAREDADGPAAERLEREREDLAALRDYALPVVDALAGLPERAPWGEWQEALAALATRVLRAPERVLAVIAELQPMAEVGPIALREVQLVLASRLQELAVPPVGPRYGSVFVAPVEAARGLAFDVVFVPGLAERLFPRKIEEEPILLDRLRERLNRTFAAQLPTNAQRAQRERRALRLAVGASRRVVVLSYPRIDEDGARPRVPSFYALEALRAAEGVLPGFAQLARRAETLGAARLGWPAPPHREDAIDEAEHDLALLESLRGVDAERSRGAARYLLDANPHLGRALRFRARRWLEAWTSADGLVKPAAAARSAVAAHALGARSYSPTAFQHFALCPYRFFLYAVQRLSPREEPEAIEELSALQRGSLVHDVQFELFGALREAELLPVTVDRLPAAWKALDEALGSVEQRYRDELAPAIERVWRDGVESVRADLREWLRRASEERSGFVPWRFELSFGLEARRPRDPASREAAVELAGGVALRGSIDLVERAEDGRLRVTDHKTGRERFARGGVVDGGRALQPVLYALAAERLFAGARVESGRLYYCTRAGGFEERIVPLDARAREAAAAVIRTIGDALREPFLPAAPAEGACRGCDFRPVCGPYEEQRTARKWKPALEPLAQLRMLP